MKIVQLCPYALARPGGVQRHVSDLSSWLTAQGHETRIIAPPAPGHAPQHHGSLIEIGTSRSFGTHGTAFGIARARRRDVGAVTRDLTTWGAELVHIHTPWTPMLVWQMWRALRLPTVTTIHATLPEARGQSLIERYIRCAARHFIRHSNAIVVPSDAPLAMLRDMVPDLNAHILPPAVDLSSWRATPRPDRGDCLDLMFLGRLEPRKGVDILLDAWPRIAAALPGATLTIAGDGALREQVIAATNDRLHYIDRPDDAAARALLARADIFAAPAPYGESYGLVLAEAMSAGAVPVAAANAGYVSVMGKGSDLLVEPGNAGALAGRIIALAANRPALQAHRKWAAERALASDISRVGPDYATLYSGVLAKSG